VISAGRIKKARCGDLPSVPQTLGMRLHREGRGFASASHDSLKFFRRGDVWLYKWWARDGEVGDGIQFLRRHHGMRFTQALSALAGSASFPSESAYSKHRAYSGDIDSLLRLNLFDPVCLRLFESIKFKLPVNILLHWLNLDMRFNLDNSV
jgi:hypothetical protein